MTKNIELINKKNIEDYEFFFNDTYRLTCAGDIRNLLENEEEARAKALEGANKRGIRNFLVKTKTSYDARMKKEVGLVCIVSLDNKYHITAGFKLK